MSDSLIGKTISSIDGQACNIKTIYFEDGTSLEIEADTYRLVGELSLPVIKLNLKEKP